MFTAIVGAQFGSEGKGVVAAAMAHRFDMAVRVGGPNAGHSFKVLEEDGTYTVRKMRGVPCAWINEDCSLWIGAGAVVDPHLLARELDDLPGSVRVYVDRAAVVVTEEDMRVEADDWGLGRAIGSTTEGVGVARIKRIRRDETDDARAGSYASWHPQVKLIENTASIIARSGYAGTSVMLEGTQGSGLSLEHGPWPKVTSADTNASGLLSQVGLPPSALGGPEGHVFLVARTLPIRVAGPSGPMEGELTWDKIPVDQPERTTVTNKVRRIAMWDHALWRRSVIHNDPCGVFLMFGDYLVPEMAGTTDAGALLDAARPTPLGDLRQLTEAIEHDAERKIPVVAYGTGGPGWSLAFRGRCAHGVSWGGNE